MSKDNAFKRRRYAETASRHPLFNTQVHDRQISTALGRASGPRIQATRVRRIDCRTKKSSAPRGAHSGYIFPSRGKYVQSGNVVR